MLARLRTARPELETWTEQLRAWLAADLLQPLVRLLNGTHKVNGDTSCSWALQSVNQTFVR